MSREGGLCPVGLCLGSLSTGALSRVVSGGLCPGRGSVQGRGSLWRMGSLFRGGGFYPGEVASSREGGLCPRARGLCSG